MTTIDQNEVLANHYKNSVPHVPKPVAKVLAKPAPQAIPDMTKDEVVSKLRQAICDLTIMQYFSPVTAHAELASQFSKIAGKLVDLQTKVNAL